jgi:hypothetical protein
LKIPARFGELGYGLRGRTHQLESRWSASIVVQNVKQAPWSQGRWRWRDERMEWQSRFPR